MGIPAVRERLVECSENLAKLAPAITNAVHAPSTTSAPTRTRSAVGTESPTSPDCRARCWSPPATRPRRTEPGSRLRTLVKEHGSSPHSGCARTVGTSGVEGRSPRFHAPLSAAWSPKFAQHYASLGVVPPTDEPGLSHLDEVSHLRHGITEGLGAGGGDLVRASTVIGFQRRNEPALLPTS